MTLGKEPCTFIGQFFQDTRVLNHSPRRPSIELVEFCIEGGTEKAIC